MATKRKNAKTYTPKPSAHPDRAADHLHQIVSAMDYDRRYKLALTIYITGDESTAYIPCRNITELAQLVNLDRCTLAKKTLADDWDLLAHDYHALRRSEILSITVTPAASAQQKNHLKTIEHLVTSQERDILAVDQTSTTLLALLEEVKKSKDLNGMAVGALASALRSFVDSQTARSRLQADYLKSSHALRVANGMDANYIAAAASLKEEAIARFKDGHADRKRKESEDKKPLKQANPSPFFDVLDDNKGDTANKGSEPPSEPS